MARLVAVAVLAGGGVLGASIVGGHEPKDAAVPAPPASHDHDGGDQRRADGHPHEHHGADAHVHAPVPPEYRSAHVPAAAWTEPRMIARGKEIYATRCAVCHGDRGDGKGPAGVALPLRPPDLRNEKMVREMAGNYWFWRVSEGGMVEPFRSMGSTMPAWKDELSVTDRWAVIAYQHTFSGHDGPHVVSEHAELGLEGPGTQPPMAAGDGVPPAAHGGGVRPSRGSEHKH